MNYNISYCITLCDEIEEIKKLIETLKLSKRSGDEILVLVDSKKATPEIYSFMEEHHRNEHSIIDSFWVDEFKGDFSEWKNILVDRASKEYLFFIDADEIPNPQLLDDLSLILELNNDVDIFGLPRQNFVEGITDEYIKQVGWRKDELNRINYPDYQYRIMKRKPGIQWGGKLHETIIGGDLKVEFPPEVIFSLLHIKTFDKQKKQNDFYSKL